MINRLATWWTTSEFARRRALSPEIRESAKLSQALAMIRTRWPGSSAPMPSASSPVFVLSAGWGSGSTLLQRLIVSSKEVLLWGEPLDHAVPAHRLSQMLMPFNDRWPKDAYFSNSADIETLERQWIANLTPEVSALRQAHRDFFLAWLGKPATQAGRDRWGYKEVRLTVDHARYLKWLFPDARLVFIYRDVLDAFRSCKGVRWLSVWPEYRVSQPISFAHHWLHLLRGFLSEAEELGGMLIRYEDLVSETFDLQSLADHLELNSIDKTILQQRIGSRGAERAPLTRYERSVILSITNKLRHTLGYE